MAWSRGFSYFFVYNFSEPQKFFPAKKLNFGEPQKFIPAKCKNFAVGLNRKSFFPQKFLPLKYLILFSYRKGYSFYIWWVFAFAPLFWVIIFYGWPLSVLQLKRKRYFKGRSFFRKELLQCQKKCKFIGFSLLRMLGNNICV